MSDQAFEHDGKNPDLLSALKLVNVHLGETRWRLYFSIFAAALSVGLELVPFWCTYELIRMLVAGTAETADFYRFGFVLLAVIPATYLLFGVATTQSHIVAFRLIHNLRKRMAAHLARLPLGYFSKQQSGTVRKLMVDEPERLELIVAHAIPEGISALLSWLAVSVWMFWMDWRMALAAIVLTPIAFTAMGAAIKRSMPEMKGYQKANAHLNGVIGEFLAGISAIKVFRHADRTRTEAEEAIRDYADKQSEMGRRWVPLGGTFYALVLANLTVILPVGAWLHARGSLGLPELLFFVVLGGNYSAPLMRLFNLFHQFAHISMAAGLIQDTFDVRVQHDSGEGQDLAGHDVALEQVDFAYDSQPVLQNVSFVARSGTTTALVGPSGSGKSTIAHLVARFYDLPAGYITIGGADIRQMSQAQLMQTVSFVFQDTFLFVGTIAENLRFACPHASEADLHRAATAAQAHGFILALPQGYDTEIGEGGVALSGGEKQRIAIARAILKDAPVIVLDEATAFADPDSEVEIQKAISAMTAGKTVIVVAHRLHTIAAADQILVLDGGRLVERGTHTALLAQDGLYACMWQDYMAVRSRGLQRANTMRKAAQ